MNFESLAQLGFGPYFSQQIDLDELAHVGRVIADSATACRVRMAESSIAVELSPNAPERPVVGDWIIVDDAPEPPRVARVLARRTQLLRKQAGQVTRPQLLAANIDRIMILEALGDAVNLRRIERFLAAAWATGAEPLVLLNKADRSERPVDTLVGEVMQALGIMQVLAISALTGDGLAALLETLVPSSTTVLIGPSGVGKSTLVNRLLGDAAQAVSAVRTDDDKGRHTTTGRSLWQLPTGALLIDSPGIRELALWDGSGIEATFAEIAELAEGCRFRDCAHEAEPGCAVQTAVAEGLVDPKRLANYQKLLREEAYLTRKQDQHATQAHRQQIRQRTRSYRAHQQASERFKG